MCLWIRRNRIWISRALIFLSVPVALLTSHSRVADADMVLDAVGAVLVAVGVLGRIWATLYIAGRKNQQLVTHGPYSICRNPLYLFSTLIVCGVLCLFGNALLALPIAVIYCLTYGVTIRQEEARLQHLFAEDYTAYKRNVPRLVPALWKYDVSPMPNGP